MLTEFLTFARPHDPELRPTHVHEIVERVTALLQHEAEKQSVSIASEVPPGLPPVLADAEQMTQVIFNVVLNAIQATRAEGRVRIRESSEPGWRVIDVMDDGPGIPPEHALRLFDPFFTTKPRGTGLGLAISHRIVTAHRGTIEALPGARGGSIIRIRLPMTPSPRASVDSQADS
jgi:signal transduction histidine kinase